MSCVALLALGAMFLAPHALKHAWVTMGGGSADSSFSGWWSQTVHAQGAGGAPTFVTFETKDAGTNMLQGSTGISINAGGDIAGIYVNATNLAHGFLRVSATSTITEFDAPDAGTATNEGTFPFGINTTKDIAGMYSDGNVAYRGFVRAGATGTITEFDVPGAPTTTKHRGTVPLAIDAGGDITGFYVNANAVRHGFVRTVVGGNPAFSTFDVAGAGTSSTEGTVPLSIASTGDITGFYKDAGGTFHAFIRAASNGTITAPIDAPNASSGAGGKVSFRGTIATSIDSAGDIAGVYADANGVYHGFVRAANATFTSPIDAPGAAAGGVFGGTVLASMNDSGVTTGFYEDANGLNHGFVRAANGTFTAPLDAPGASTGTIGMFPGGTVNVSINDSGVVTGGYFDKNGVGHAFSLTLALAQAAAPTFNPPAGTYTSAQSVTLADTTAGAVIHYTTNGSTPDASSPVFSSAIPVNSSETIEAIAVASGFSDSTVATAAYVINQPAPDFLVSVNPTTLTIVAGMSGNAIFTVTPQNGFNSQVSFSCSGLPAEASCSFNPPNVTPNGAAASTTLTLSTVAPSGAVPVSMPTSPRPFYTLLFAALTTIFFVIAHRRRVPRGLELLGLLLVLTGVFGLPSCGGGSGGNSGTPTGTTTASVSAGTGGGGINHAASLKIVITH
jgi:hypothetical protein